MTRDECLVLLIEECGEVIQAATKCLRFGFDRDQPGYGINSAVLSAEIGDLFGVVDALPLSRESIEMFRSRKMAKAERVKAELIQPALQCHCCGSPDHFRLECAFWKP